MRCAHIPGLIGAKRLAGSAGIKNAPKAHTQILAPLKGELTRAKRATEGSLNM